MVLNREQNIVMEAAQFPGAQKFVGQDLVCTDGTTLLGADDKAGIAIILQAVEELLAEKAPHGKICLGFTPDEEIGMGASFRRGRLRRGLCLHPGRRRHHRL